MADLTVMDALIAKALKALRESGMNEIELFDGINRVRVSKDSPTITCYPSYPWNYQTQFPNYNY